MADFHIFTGDEVIATDLPNLLNTNFSSLKNCFSGTTAPTTNLTVGQFFFNTSTKVLYQLTEIKSSGEVVWTSLGHIATKAEAEAGRDNTKQMTPLRTYEAIQKLAPLMTGATATTDGKQGIVPQPLKGEEDFVLHGDGEWRVVKDFESYWESSERVQVGDVRVPRGRENSGYVLECVKAGVTGESQPVLGENVVEDEFNLNNFEGTLSVEKGGTGVKTIEEAKKVFGIDSVDRFPIGTILPFGGNEVPVGYLTCNGAAVSRTTYADLFAVIGTTYGAGNGSTTFNLPNLNNNSFLEGSDTVGTVKSAGLPNITGRVGNATTSGYVSGAFYSTSGNSYGWYGEDGYNQYFDASRSNPIYGKSDTVQPKSVTVKYIIKAFSSVTNAGNIDVQNLASDYERVNTELAKLSGISDYIVESYRNGTEWYEVYKSGKVRQGGQVRYSSTRDKHQTITLLKELKTSDYVPTINPLSAQRGSETWIFGVGTALVTTSSFLAHIYGFSGSDVSIGFEWQVVGQGA